MRAEAHHDQKIGETLHKTCVTLCAQSNCMCHGICVRAKDNRREPLLSFHHSSPWNWTRHQAESAARTFTQPYSRSHLPPPVGPPHRSTGIPLTIHLGKWKHLSPLATSAQSPQDGQGCCLRKNPGVDVLGRYGGAGEVEEVLDMTVFHYIYVWNSQEQR